MKKIYSLILLSAISLSAAAESVNLLQNATTTNESAFDNSDVFYMKWDCRYADGSNVEYTELPYSIFSQVMQYGTVRTVTYNKLQYSVGADEEAGFTADVPLLVLDYPGEVAFNECFYTFPITVQSSGNYTLSGCAHSIVERKYSTSSFLNSTNLMVFVAEKELGGPKTFAIVKKDNKNVLEVRGADGALLPSAYSPLPKSVMGDSYAFTGTFNLDPSYKYFSIYAPVSTWMVGGIKLEGESDLSGIEDIISPEAIQSAAEWYDLSGRRVAVGTEPTAKGVYIQRQGSASKLIQR